MLMKQAYISLLNKKRTEQITVKEICSVAEVNRSTFYLHYTEPNDILKEIEDEAITQISEYLHSIGTLTNEDPDTLQYIQKLLRFIQRNDDLFRTLLLKNSDPHFREKIIDLALALVRSSFQLPLNGEMLSITNRFIISGSLDVLIEWIRRDYDIPEQTLCDILFRLCDGSIRGALHEA